jgi:Domain of unknown function (DUF4185)
MHPFDWGSARRPQLRPEPAIVAGHPDVMFPANQPEFGDASFINGGLLYAYGCGIPAKLYAYGCGIPANRGDRDCRLGRVDPLRVQDLRAWTFYSGNGNWSSNVGDAISLFDGGGSICWNNFLQRYVAIYSGVFTQDVMIRTSPKPEGPWSGEAVAFVAMTPASGNVFDAHAHAEYLCCAFIYVVTVRLDVDRPESADQESQHKFAVRTQNDRTLADGKTVHSWHSRFPAKESCLSTHNGVPRSDRP